MAVGAPRFFLGLFFFSLRFFVYFFLRFLAAMPSGIIVRSGRAVTRVRILDEEARFVRSLGDCALKSLGHCSWERGIFRRVVFFWKFFWWGWACPDLAEMGAFELCGF